MSEGGQDGEERIFRGIGVSGGIAFGTVVSGGDEGEAAIRSTRAPRAPEEELRDLESAIARAGRELEAVMEREDELASGIIEFQRALLDDECLVDPIFAAVREGGSAGAAWAAALDREIAEYRAGGDPVLSARADDLVDVRSRVLAALASERPFVRTEGGGELYVGRNLTPSRFLALVRTRLRGAALEEGSATSHVAILARARGIPLVVGLGRLESRVADGAEAVLDAEQGRLILFPSPATLAWAHERERSLAATDRGAPGRLARPAATADGERVNVLVNADLPGSLDAVRAGFCDGIGLVRTEFLFQAGAFPDEERQLATYRRFLEWAGGRPVTIRTLDAGGDKPIPGFTIEDEPNPFLGMRGLRLSLARPGVLRVQLRALARAAAGGPLKIMVPMVTAPHEIEQAREHLDAVVADLDAAGLAHARPPLGMMVEVPAAAIEAPAFDVAFYSIGSNDLVQYVTAVARDHPTLAGLADPRHPAVLRLIRNVVAAGKAKGVEVSLCGDMASDPELVPSLLEAGLRTLSVAPASLGRIKAAIAAWPRHCPKPRR